MKQGLLLIVTLLLSICGEAQVDKNYEKGNYYARQEQYEKAIKQYNKTIRRNPKHYDAYYNRGICYGMLEKYSKAFPDLKTAYNIDKKDTLAPMAMARFNCNLSKHQDAVDQFKIAFDNGAKGDYMAYFLYGTCYFMMQEYEKAIPLLEESFMRDTTYSGTFNNLAWCFLEVDPQQSIRYFHIAYQKDTTLSYNINNLGYAYLLSKDYDQALAYFQKAEKVDSTNSFIYRNFGLYYKAIGNKEKACFYLNKCVKMGFLDKWGLKYLAELNDYCKEEEESVPKKKSE